MKAKILHTLLLSILIGLLVAVPASASLDAAPVTISGTITDPLGNGVSGQWVTLTSEDGATVLTTQSAADGSYAFADVNAGNYFIRVSNTQISRNVPPRYWLSTQSAISLQSTATLDIALPFTLMVVEVKEPSMAPMENVDLFTSRPYNTALSLAGFPAHGKSQYIEEEPAVTDGNGVSMLWLFPTQGDQTYDVTAKPDLATGYGAKIVRAVPLTETNTLTIIMDPPQNLSGVVSYPAGTPLANQVVSAIPQPPETTSYPSATTRPSGSFVFSVMPTNYNLRVEKNGYSADTPPSYWISTTNFPLAILADQKYYAAVEMPFEEITLTVTDEQGNPVANAAVVTDQPTNNNLSLDGYPAAGASQYTNTYPAFTNTNGAVTLRLFPTEGSTGYTVTVTPPAGSSAGSITIPGVHVPATQPVHVVLKPKTEGSTSNQAPVANSGPDQSVSCNTPDSVVVLDGSGSYDPDGDLLNYSWSGGFLSSTVSGEQIQLPCPDPGSYTLTLKVTDPSGASDTSSFNLTVSSGDSGKEEHSKSVEAFAGGGGWFWSPEGAYSADPSASGKLTIGFVVRYQNGDNVPSGHTVIRLHGTDLAIWAYDFSNLTIDGNLAKYVGTGVDKEGNQYRMKVTLYNGWDPGDEKGADMIRIKVWDLSTREVVYDNQAGSPDSANLTTELQGGSIVIKEHD